ncbi:Cytosolic Fe-S cluster assembly factor nar1 [Myotisia sp. PD_48]|nr:Cytosolic Fe-S cluster assembly factor nar1 [Myotisia sp. PD_48]
MSAILSADDLNDFISPGVACIKPVETLPKSQSGNGNPYEVTTEDEIEPQNAPPAQISLTDCLACSGCVTSAEAVLISLQSHAEVLNTLDSNPEIPVGGQGNAIPIPDDGKIFVASVSPQVRASLAATFGISELKATHMIEQFLSGPNGLRAGGKHGSGFSWILDTNIMRQAILELSAAEVTESLNPSISATSNIITESPVPKRPILSSACPGWICYAEKTHPHLLPHLSRLKSPQALTGTFVKTVLSKALNIPPSRIWHLALMPCFDKKLEASRQELTDISWRVTDGNKDIDQMSPVRDVDCVITSRELLMLASSRNISLPDLRLEPLSSHFLPAFPDQRIGRFLMSDPNNTDLQSPASGPSGGYLYHILSNYRSRYPGSVVKSQRGRNADVVEYTLMSSSGDSILKAARYYGFRNIQNLVRKLKPARASRLPGLKPGNAGSAVNRANIDSSRSTLQTRPSSGVAPCEYAYVEVMACPGGCTNGGGQIRLEDARNIANFGQQSAISTQKVAPQDQRAWLARIDEAYFSDDSDKTAFHPYISADSSLRGLVNSQDDFYPHDDIQSILQYWSSMTEISLAKLVYTTFRKVESDVGKNKGSGTIDTSRVIQLASKDGGGW